MKKKRFVVYLLVILILSTTIVQAYGEFLNKEYVEKNTIVESKIFANDFFGFRKVTVESPLKDESGKLILKKGKVQADPSLHGIYVRSETHAFTGSS